MKLYYAGIGSRETPSEVLEIMKKLGQLLAEKGWVLRSGGADGADKAFEEGCDLGKGEKEIFLPWKGFNDNKSTLYFKSKEIPDAIKQQAFALAEDFHPVWFDLSYGAKCLHARNGLQILGRDLNTPVSAVLFWSKYVTKGGTSQALRIAAEKGISIFNVGTRPERMRLSKHLEMNLEFLEASQKAG
jgi:hypothetical protein